MVAKKQNERGDGIEVFTVHSPEELPGRRIRKGGVLQALPEVQEIVEKVRKGLGAGEIVGLKLGKERMAQLKITTPGRILKEIFQTLIATEGLTSKTGNKLDVQKYRSDDGGEVVTIADAVQLYKRSSSIKRTAGRHQGKP